VRITSLTVLAIWLLTSAFSCTRLSSDRTENPAGMQGDSELTIIMVNSSQDLVSIDIEITIDDVRIYTGILENLPPNDDAETAVRITAHERIALQLPKGAHSLRVISNRGHARLEKSFELTDRLWMWIGYEDWDHNGTRVPPHQFAYWTRETPIMFE